MMSKKGDCQCTPVLRAEEEASSSVPVCKIQVLRANTGHILLTWPLFPMIVWISLVSIFFS